MSVRPLVASRRSLVLAALLLIAAFPAGAAKRVLNGKIAFVSDRDGNNEIYVMNADGTGVTRLTNDRADDVDPAWSPDGRRIAFAKDGQIHVMNADGSGVTNLTSDFSVNRGPAWSPDGRRIAFHSDRDADGNFVIFEIYTMAADGTVPIRLTDLPGDHSSAAWSPDGRTIAFVCQDFSSASARQICAMNADGTDVRVLTDNARDQRDADPSFSPDGRKIVFTRTGYGYDGKAEVVTMNPDGSDLNRLYNGFYVNANHPVFAPDGTKIAFSAGPEYEDHSVLVMDADGTNDEVIEEGNFDNRDPNWQRTFPPDTVGVYVSNGQWLLRTSNTAGNPNIIVKFGGQPGDLPVAGDWNGDGRTDVAVYRNGTFVRGLVDSNSFCIPCQLLIVPDLLDTIPFGEPGDLPVAGDWDGDGIDDLGVFRPGDQGTFLLRLPQVICPFCVPPRTVIGTQTLFFGTSGLPIAGDWDGDGKDGIGLYEPASATFFLSDDLAKPNFTFTFGLPGDRPLSGDWVGSGRDGIGVFQPPTSTMVLSTELNAAPDFTFVFGVAEGLPVAGHWTAVSSQR